MTQAQVQTSDNLVVAVGEFPAGSHDPDTIRIQDLTDEQAQQIMTTPGTKYLAEDGTLTIVPPPPPPLVYTGLARTEGTLQTTDGNAQQALGFAAASSRLYAIRLVSVAMNDATFQSGLFETIALVRCDRTGVIGQVGFEDTVKIADGDGAGWSQEVWVGMGPDGPEVRAYVTGWPGMTVNWLVAMNVGTYAPDGVQPESGAGVSPSVLDGPPFVRSGPFAGQFGL